MEKASLLDDRSDLEVATQDNDFERAPPVPAHKTLAFRLLVALSSFLTLAVVGLSVAVCQLRHTTHGIPEPYTPVLSAVKYRTAEPIRRDDWMRTPFRGPPSQRQFDAYLQFSEPTLQSSTAEELRLAGVDLDQAVQMYDSDRYLSTLGIYHELHCLRYMRHWIHRGYYFPNTTDQEWEDTQEHIDHCFEVIRETLVCNPNLAMYTFRWEPGMHNPQLRSDYHSTCVDWKSVDDWARERTVGFHPQFFRPSDAPQESDPKAEELIVESPLHD